MSKECKDCVFFDTDPSNVKQGFCHRYPPTLAHVVTPTKLGAMSSWQSSFTPIKGDAWCGEFLVKVKIVQ